MSFLIVLLERCVFATVGLVAGEGLVLFSSSEDNTTVTFFVRRSRPIFLHGRLLAVIVGHVRTTQALEAEGEARLQAGGGAAMRGVSRREGGGALYCYPSQGGVHPPCKASR